MHRVVIVGGGFGGLSLAETLRRAPIDVMLIDRQNYHLFQPLLYQVATGALSPGDIASPLRSALRRQRNARVLLDEVVGIEAAARRVNLRRAAPVPYDTLVIAAGLTHNYFGHDEWAQRAPGLKSIADAVDIRSRVLEAFESAERETDPAAQGPYLNFVVVGAGPTGVELAGALAELAHGTLRGEFRGFDPRNSRVALIEGATRVLPAFPAELSTRAQRSLERLGVNVLLQTHVTAIDDGGVTFERDGRAHHLAARTVLWAAGVRGVELGGVLAAATGAQLDELGRVIVGPDLALPARPEIFVIGDLARVLHRGQPLAAVAPAAMQEGRYVGRVIRNRLANEHTAPFRYVDKGYLATIGRSAAVASFGRLRLWGFPAWLLWLFVHLLSH